MGLGKNLKQFFGRNNMLGIRLFLIGILASAVVGAGVYVMKLRSDNAILKANAVKMESAITEQKNLSHNKKRTLKKY